MKIKTKGLARTTNLACLIAVVLLAKPCFASDAVTLQLRLPKGFKAKTTAIATNNQTASVSPPSAHATTDEDEHTYTSKYEYAATKEYLIECVDVDTAGVMTVRETITATKLTIKNGDAISIEYDSRDKANPTQPLSVYFAAHINNPLTYRISPSGIVLKVIGADAWAEKIEARMKKARRTQKVSQPSPDPKKEKAMLLDRAKYSRPVAVLRFYPTSPVKTGHTWVTPSLCSGKVCPPLDVSSVTWTLQSVSDGVARLKYTAKSRPAKPTLPGKTVLDSSIKSDGTCEMQIDLRTGLSLSSKSMAETTKHLVFTRDGSDKQETSKQSGTITRNAKTTFLNNATHSTSGSSAKIAPSVNE